MITNLCVKLAIEEIEHSYIVLFGEKVKPETMLWKIIISTTHLHTLDRYFIFGYFSVTLP